MINRTKEEKIKLLNETVEYYSEDPEGRRCRVGRVCAYSATTVGKEETSSGCAVGRLLSPELRKELDYKFPGNTVVSPDIWLKIPDDVASYGKEFLRDLQTLHDEPIFWHSKGLTKDGEVFVKNLKNRINEDFFN